MRCSACWKEIESCMSDIIYNEWLKLMHYFEHEYLEGEITENTYKTMEDALMSLKPWEEESTDTENEEVE